MRLYEEKEYKGYTLIKLGKQHIQVRYNNELIGYATTEEIAKDIVDKKENYILKVTGGC